MYECEGDSLTHSGDNIMFLCLSLWLKSRILRFLFAHLRLVSSAHKKLENHDFISKILLQNVRSIRIWVCNSCDCMLFEVVITH